jgi:hypothetical protein
MNTLSSIAASAAVLIGFGLVCPAQAKPTLSVDPSEVVFYVKSDTLQKSTIVEKTDLPSRVKRRRIVHNQSTTPPLHVASVLLGVFARGGNRWKTTGTFSNISNMGA